MQYVTEYQQEDGSKAPRYVCNLCESKCDPHTLITHLTGFKHRELYLASSVT